MTDFTSWPSNVDPDFKQWLVKRGIAPEAWNTYGQSWRSNLRSKFRTERSHPQPQQAPLQHSDKTGRRWPDNVSTALQTYLTKQGVTIDDWYNKGESFRSEMRAQYHKTASDGAFHFSADDVLVLRQAGWTDQLIAQHEHLINNSATASDRVTAYQQVMAQARLDAGKHSGQVFGADLDANGNPIQVQVTSGKPFTKYNPINPTDPNAVLTASSTPQTAAITDVTSAPFNWSKDQIVSLQNELVAKGLLDANGFISGKYDSATITAYDGLIHSANTSKMTPQEYLDALPAGGSKNGPFTAPAEARTSAVDIKKIADETARAIVGRDATPSEIAHITTRVRTSEDVEYAATKAQAQAEHYNQSGGTQVTQAPSVEDIATNELDNTTEAQGYRVAQAGLQLLNFMKGGG